MKVGIRIPQSGTQSAATFVDWSVRVGDRVAAGDALGTVETEKAVVQIEAPVAGVVSELSAVSNDEVTTDTAIGFIEADEAIELAPQSPRRAPRAAEPGMDAQRYRYIEWPAAQRRAAENLLWVAQHTAHASTTVEVDFEAVAALRASLGTPFQESNGIALTYLPFVAFIAVRTASRFTQIMAYADEHGTQLITPNGVHLGIAVARDSGLIVPVIRDAQQMGFVQLAQRMSAVAAKAREGLLGPDELQGGSITLTNPGAFGSFLSAPIVRRGESAILCIDGIHKRVVPIGEQVAIRRQGNLTLAFDHRIIDGQLALKFLNEMKGQLESFDPDWIDEGGEHAEGAA
jgi:pyruvate/2-oxoglutarate dehydrogenase complex dihydrolipoamide acyltransferase (E2) component